MTFAIIRSFALVTLGAFVAGHTLVLWARHRAAAADLVPLFGIGVCVAAVGIALDGRGALASAVLVAALALMVVALLALVRRRSRSAS